MARAESATDAVAAEAPAPRPRLVAITVLVVVTVVVYAFDQLSKFLIIQNLALGERVPLIGELLELHFVKNPGAAFSLGSGSTWVFAIIASVVAVVIVLFARRIRSVGWALVFGLLLGGNLGNLTDRLFREPGFGVGHVIDFVQIYGFPGIFNLADSAIVLSMAVFVVLAIRGVRLDGSRAEPGGADVATAPARHDEPPRAAPTDD